MFLNLRVYTNLKSLRVYLGKSEKELTCFLYLGLGARNRLEFTLEFDNLEPYPVYHHPQPIKYLNKCKNKQDLIAPDRHKHIYG